MALAVLLWGWLVSLAVSGGLAAATGGSLRSIGGATALAAAPALLGFLVLHRLRERRVIGILAAAWLLAAVGLMMGSGGAASPLAAALLIAPAWSLALGGARVVEAGAAAVLGYAVAAWGANLLGAAEPTGLLPHFLAAVALAFVAGLLALRRDDAAPPASVREAAMAQRLAEVSHDLRTPLNHIIGFSEVLEKEIFGAIGPRNVEYAGLIRSSGQHLLHMVNDLLDLSKLDAGRYEIVREHIDVRALIEDVVRVSGDAAAKKNITLTHEPPHTPLMVHADPHALRRMLINVIDNAVKFTPEGGRVTVAARADQERLIIDTLDTGPGIPEAERARLGHAYQRGEGAARVAGTGLGLALVRALAALHGGALSFHDAPGGGALVRIEAPVVDA